MLASIIQDAAITNLLPALARVNEPVNGERLHNTAYGALEHGIPENRCQEKQGAQAKTITSRKQNNATYRAKSPP